MCETFKSKNYVSNYIPSANAWYCVKALRMLRRLSFLERLESIRYESILAHQRNAEISNEASHCKMP